MNAALAHRGPNDSGSYFDEQIALGHRRLSIIDLSSKGHQPMSDYNRRLHIVYNGELYNFKELRLELQRSTTTGAAAYPFSTQSDTEVVLAAYLRWGVECLKKFNGMFAFAIWDREKKELFAARDRLGIKPFYYYHANDTFVFSSEIRAMLRSGLVPRKINKMALGDYVSYQTVHEPETIIENVKMLSPGHYLILKPGLDKMELNIQPWWKLNGIPVIPDGKPYKEVCKNVRELLFKAVERRLISDVPFGAFLSGGIDSSAVVGIMSQVMSNKVKTFSVVFEEKEFSESRWAQLIAKKFGTEHHEIQVSPASCLEKLPMALGAMDHPSGDGINTWFVSEATKAGGITMALSGLGGDELFAGYPLFKRLYKLDKINYLKILLSLPAFLNHTIRPSPASEKLLNLLRKPSLKLKDTHSVSRATIPLNQMVSLLETKPNRPTMQEFNNKFGLLSQMTIAELSVYLHDTLLRDTDQMSMSHALEVRVPFLDYTLVEYVAGLSDKYKYPSTPKKLLVDSMGDLLPEDIASRKKMGFTFPWNQWMKGELHTFCETNILGLAERSYFCKEPLQNAWRLFLKGNPLMTWNKLWHLIVLENWLKTNGIE
jgi:asparagine synthase (glutamine-hydrolysing)